MLLQSEREISRPDGLEKLLTLQNEAFGESSFGVAREMAKNLFARVIDTCTVRRPSSEKDVEVSIIIVIHKANDYTIELLKSCATWSFTFSHEIVIVLNDEKYLRNTPDLLETFVVVDSPVNLGASGGRNLGAHFSRGRFYLHLDDDGATTAESISHLYRTAVDFDATAVRGRVRQRDENAEVPRHYDLGSTRTPCLIDIEGITIWHAERVDAVGGFDPLLFGHEGAELFARLYPWHGPHSFIYEPKALLLHDFAADPAKRAAKTERYRKNLSYLKWKGTRHEDLIRSFGRLRADPIERSIFLTASSYIQEVPQTQDVLVSVMTTARDAAHFMEDYSRSLRQQTYQNFEIVFVDDNSADDTIARLEGLWRGDERLRIIRNAGDGRASALNAALKACRGDICVVADADDLMVPRRLEWSVIAFEKKPSRACVSFYIYNERASLRGTRPFVDNETSLRLRRFIGMPGSFPAFAFRRDKFTLPFDESLEAGIDCDWLFRNLDQGPEYDGDLIPLAVSYYRLHDGQITNGKRNLQQDVSYGHVERLHRQRIDFDEDRDRHVLLKIMGWTAISSGGEFRELYDYVYRFGPESNFDGEGHLIRSYLRRAVGEAERRRQKADYANLKSMLERERQSARDLSSSASTSLLSATGVSMNDVGNRSLAAAYEGLWKRKFEARKKLTRWIPLLGDRAIAPATPFYFDEDFYLEQHPDVRSAVSQGQFATGYHHYVLHGRTEGRQWRAICS